MRRVMVVDDNPAVVNMMAQALRREGYEVNEAHSGIDAIEKMNIVGIPDVLVTDIVMPSMRGDELIRQAQGKGVTRFVAISSHDFPSGLPQGTKLIKKPQLLPQLLKNIAALIAS